MKVDEQVSLSAHTTFRIGGPVSLFITAETVQEIPEAYELARTRELIVYPLGQGSNVLAGDEPIKKAIITLVAKGISYEAGAPDDEIIVTAEGGASWDELVEATTQQGLWGIENLAGIPGTVGASPVQNIGAYGVEVQDSILYVDAYDPTTKSFVRFAKPDCDFAYRDSRFKREPRYFITSVSFSLSRKASPRLSYKDIEGRREEGAVLDTSADIAREIRSIRSHKFPDLKKFGTAGSFFKNPVITNEHYAQLVTTYPELPGFGVESGIKVPLAWILDHVLHLRGFLHGPVSLFERQPLVMIATANATKCDVDALAKIVHDRVYEVSNIIIEREVQSLK